VINYNNRGDMKRIEDHEVIVHGVEHEQYFQGCGVSFTPFTDVATGIGDDAAEAFEDALESLAQGDWEVEEADDWPDAPRPDAATLDEDAHEDLHVYVSVRVKGREAMSPEQIKDKYEPRIAKVLGGIVAALREDEPTLHVGEPYDMHGDDYRWSFNVHTAADAELAATIGDEPMGADVSFVICESEQYDGEKFGVNFAVEIVGVGGEIIGGLTPYNYTGECWVSRCDAEAIEERFAIVERCDPSEAAHLVIDWLRQQASATERSA
jgi:hypothetical protein